MNIARTLFAACAVVLSFVQADAAQFALTWTDNSTNEKGFEVERAPGLDAAAGFELIAVVGANVVQYVDAGLPNETAYSYRLRAYNDAGTSGYSNTASGTTPPAKPNGTPGLEPLKTEDKYEPPVPTVTLAPGNAVRIVAGN